MNTETSSADDVESARRRFLFTRLVLTFQTAAMQQMGKLSDPFTGAIARDLTQAAISIDTLDMLHERCRGNLSAEEERFLSLALSELKLNYVDELTRPEPTPSPSSEPSTTAGEQPPAG
jgi:hypothetical protein